MISHGENLHSDAVHVDIDRTYFLHAVDMMRGTYMAHACRFMYLMDDLSRHSNFSFLSQNSMISLLIQLLNSSFSMGECNSATAECRLYLWISHMSSYVN